MRPEGLLPEAIDCHVHAGLERSQTLQAMLGYCREDGRRAVGLLDHAELYFVSPPGWAQIALDYAARKIAAEESLADMIDLFRKRLRGPEVFYRHAREVTSQRGSGMRTALGLEVSGASLEAGACPAEWLDGADFLGICTTQPPTVGRRTRQWGEHLARLVSLADELRGGRAMGLVLHHPFRWRLYEMARDSADAPRGRLPEAGGFTDEDARVTARALADAGGLAEINFASFYAGYIQEQIGSPGRTREVIAAARGAFERLRDVGVMFSLGSDMHAVPKATGVYQPAELMRALGLAGDDVDLPFTA